MEQNCTLMEKIKTKIILSIMLLAGLEMAAQTVYSYSTREYYDYNTSKQAMILNTKDRVGSKLIINDEKRTILFQISGIDEVANYVDLIVKGPVNLGDGKLYLHYVYISPKNDVLHFYISKESAKIESYGSMLRLSE